MTAEQFSVLVATHDFTFENSDDAAKWRSGRDSLERIRKAASELGMAEAARIWNEAVDHRISASVRHLLYWTVPVELSPVAVAALEEESDLERARR